MTIDVRIGSDARTLSRARSFIEEHAGDDISAEDIAAAASVTVRSVQLAFRRYLNTTPGSYLRAVRLQHAHRELLEAIGSPGTTVGAVAAHWRFGSASRFAAYYRQAFGVLPSQTMGQRSLVSAAAG